MPRGAKTASRDCNHFSCVIVVGLTKSSTIGSVFNLDVRLEPGAGFSPALGLYVDYDWWSERILTVRRWVVTG